MAVSPTPPSISVLPPAPLPTDAEAVFDVKAGVRLTAEEVMVTEQNAALAWQAGSMAETKGYKDAAATYASNAADSATLAGDKLTLATTQANNASASANSAQVAAAAAGAAAGLPSLVGHAGDILTVNPNELGASWQKGLPDMTGNAGKTLQVTVGGLAPAWVELGIIYATEERATLVTSPDISPNGTYATRTLNTVKSNTITGASLASNAITLPAGTYRIRGTAPQVALSYGKLRIFNVTAGTVLALGPLFRDSSTPATIGTLHVYSGEVTFASATTLRLEHRTQDAANANFVSSFSANFGDTNTFSTLLAERVK